jgi:hypothetical protein
MRQLSIRKKKYEIREKDYLTMLRDLVESNCDFAEGIYNYHVSGFADWRDTFRMTDAWNNDIAIALTDQINDYELIREFKVLKKIGKSFKEWILGFQSG